MYNNTNTEVSPQLGNHGKKTKETYTFMLENITNITK
jgi:hypothetical protein